MKVAFPKICMFFLGPVISIPGGGVQHVVQVFLDWIQAKKFLRSLFVKFLANLGPLHLLILPDEYLKMISNDKGSGMILECRVSALSAPPKTLHWLKGGQVLHHHHCWLRLGHNRNISQKVSTKERLGLSLETERLATSSRWEFHPSFNKEGFFKNLYLYFVCVRAVLVFGSAEVGDTGNYTCAADHTTQTVLLIVTPGPGLPHHIHYLGSEAMEI